MSEMDANFNATSTNGSTGRKATPTGPKPLQLQRIVLGAVLFGAMLFIGLAAYFWVRGNRPAAMVVGTFAMLFMGVDVWVLRHVLRRQHQQRQAQEQLRSNRPDQPWLLRPDWAAGRIKSAGRKAVWYAWLLAVFVNGVSCPVLFAFPGEWAKGNKAILIGLIFPLVGLGFLIAAIRMTIHWRKFGQSEFRMLGVPGALGGALRGAIEVPAKVRPRGGFKLSLVCVRRTVSGSGKNRSVREAILWDDAKVILKDLLEQDRQRTGVPVFFNLPGDLPESLDGNPGIIWRLSISADVPGVDYSETFEVPVFRTAESAAQVTPLPDPTLAYQPDKSDYRPPVNTRIRVHPLADGVELYFPAGRNLVSILAALGFAALWNGILWVMVVKQAPLLFIVTWSVFDALVLGAVAAVLFYAVRVVAAGGRLKIFHRLLVPTCTRIFRADEIERITVGRSTQSSQHGFYRVEVRMRDGREYGAGDGIPDRQHAEWLAEQLSAALQLSASGETELAA